MNIIRLSIAGVATFAIGASASAQLTGSLLLRQSAFTNAGYVNQVFSDFPTYSTGMGSMVTSGANWNVSDIQVLQVGGAGINTWYGNVTTATLNVSRQVGGAPDASIDPTVGTNGGAQSVYSGIVNVVLDQGTGNANGANQSFRMTANTTGIGALQNLSAGSYVFSLVGNASFATYGQTFAAIASNLGTGNDYVRNPGGSFALPIGTAWGPMSTAFGIGANTNWGIGINGTVVPEPTSMIALGAGALALIRRRRNKS